MFIAKYNPHSYGGQQQLMKEFFDVNDDTIKYDADSKEAEAEFVEKFQKWALERKDVYVVVDKPESNDVDEVLTHRVIILGGGIGKTDVCAQILQLLGNRNENNDTVRVHTTDVVHAKKNSLEKEIEKREKLARKQMKYNSRRNKGK